MAAETRYARTTDGTHVAYQVTGDGPVDLVVMRAWITNLEHEWREPVLARMYRRLESMGRLIRLDRRGSGLSDRIRPGLMPTIEDRVDDVRAVMDAAGSRRAVLVGLAAASRLCTVFAATHPDRTAGLVLHEGEAREAWAPDYPWGETPESFEASVRELRRGWGTRELAERIIRGSAPSRIGDEAFVSWLAEDQIRSATPDEAERLARLHYETDVREVLPAVHVPTLLLARAGSGAELSRDLAERIPGARYVELPGDDHMSISGDTDAVLREMEGFIETLRDDEQDIDRVLATLLFTDIVGSTRTAVALGDRRWSHLLESHHARVRALLGRHRGRLIDTAGDGVLAAFDGPARAIRCAKAIVGDARDLGIEVRAGVHTGECEEVGDRLRGLAVHIGARVAALAAPSEVLVSGTVKDLVAGSGLAFDDRGTRELSGVPGEWRIYAVTS
jgi:class 3 adenylate cyclase